MFLNDELMHTVFRVLVFCWHLLGSTDAEVVCTDRFFSRWSIQRIVALVETRQIQRTIQGQSTPSILLRAFYGRHSTLCIKNGMSVHAQQEAHLSVSQYGRYEYDHVAPVDMPLRATKPRTQALKTLAFRFMRAYNQAAALGCLARMPAGGASALHVREFIWIGPSLHIPSAFRTHRLRTHVSFSRGRRDWRRRLWNARSLISCGQYC